MVLLIDSNAAYLVMSNAKSRLVGYFQLNHHPKRMPHLDVNDAILVLYQSLKHVVTLAAESKIAGLFLRT